MRRTLSRWSVTICAVSVMVVSLGIMGLGSIDLLPRNDVWRAAIIPAYLPLLLSAIVATATGLPVGILFWPVGAAVLLLPFVGIDRLRSRWGRPRNGQS
jgi:hypothetical protein